MDFASLHPSHSPAYSTNLYRWLRMQPKVGQRGVIHDQVFRVTRESLMHLRYGYAAGELMVGHGYEDLPHSMDFGGAQLMHVLTMGSGAERMCYLGGMDGLEPMDDFWDRYAAIGRCAIDPDHTVHFIDDGDRFLVHGDRRTCRWCGAEQHKSIRIELVEIEIWKAA